MNLLFRPLRWALLAAVFLAAIDAQAQTTSKDKAHHLPLWIQVIDDTAANYYVAVKDYEEFWKGKDKPEDEEVVMSQGTEKAKEHIKRLSKREMNEERQMDYYRYQCKRFENWMRINKPYVQADGRILTTDERLKLWQDQQKPKQ